jgi:hypothetical protein
MRPQEVRCRNVVFCAPPTGNEHYAEDVEKAMGLLKYVVTLGILATCLLLREDYRSLLLVS